MRTRAILAMFALVVSTFAIFIRIMMPTTVQLIVEGNRIEITEIPNIYNSLDMIVSSVSCFVLGSSLVYLLLVDSKDKPSLMRGNRDRILERLPNNDERKIVQPIIDEGVQSSKASWSKEAVTQRARSALSSTGLK